MTRLTRACALLDAGLLRVIAYAWLAHAVLSVVAGRAGWRVDRGELGEDA